MTRMSLKRMILLVAGLMAAGSLTSAATGALAQGRERGEERFMMAEVDGGILRIDRLSGAVSLCSGGRGDWVCELVPDDRDAMLREIEELRRENRRLTRRLARVDPGFVDERPNEFSQRPMNPDDGRVSRDEIDDAMDSFEYMMERMLGAAERFGLREPHQ